MAEVFYIPIYSDYHLFWLFSVLICYVSIIMYIICVVYYVCYILCVCINVIT